MVHILWSEGGRFSRVRGKRTRRNLLGVVRYIHSGGLLHLLRGGRSGEILSSNGVHVTPVRPDPTVRRYVARAVSTRIVRSFGLSQVFTSSSSSLEARKTTLWGRRTPARRPVFTATRSEDSGLFKGNDRFYFRSARQFEFLTERVFLLRCTLGNFILSGCVCLLGERS